MNRQIVVLIDRPNTGILLDAVKRPATRICLQSGVSISVVKTLVNGGYTSRLTLRLRRAGELVLLRVLLQENC